MGGQASRPGRSWRGGVMVAARKGACGAIAALVMMPAVFAQSMREDAGGTRIANPDSPTLYVRGAAYSIQKKRGTSPDASTSGGEVRTSSGLTLELIDHSGKVLNASAQDTTVRSMAAGGSRPVVLAMSDAVNADPILVAQASPSDGVPPAPATAPKFEIRSYVVEGNSLLKPDKINRVLAPFTGKNKDF